MTLTSDHKLAVIAGMEQMLVGIVRMLREMQHIPSAKELDGVAVLGIAAHAIDIAGRETIKAIQADLGVPANDIQH